MLDEAGFERIDELIPCQYVNGPNHGKREGDGYVYDKRLDAGGLEGQLQALRDRSRDNEPQMDFVFSDATALDARMVQKTESLLSSCFTIVVIEHTTKSFMAMNWIID